MSVASAPNQQPIVSSSVWKWSSTSYLLVCVALPFLLGCFISMKNLENVAIGLDMVLSRVFPFAKMNHRILLQNGLLPNEQQSHMDIQKCYESLVRKMFPSSSGNITFRELDQVSIVIHRNGQFKSCGNSSFVFETLEKNQTLSEMSSNHGHLARQMWNVLEDMQNVDMSCPNFSDKYHVESFLTRLIYNLLPTMSCDSEEIDRPFKESIGMFGYCDMGEDKTPILLDHKKLVPNIMHDDNHAPLSFLPCHFHTEHGIRVTSMEQLTQLMQSQVKTTTLQGSNCEVTSDGENVCSGVATPKKQIHLYAVPAGRVFMHVASHVGQIIELQHVRGADPNKLVYLEVLSLSPAVFDLHNFFTKAESQELVDRALAETRESHRIKRSTTGSVQHHVNNRRTSESGFDTDGKTAVAIKKYVLLFSLHWNVLLLICFSVLDVRL